MIVRKMLGTAVVLRYPACTNCRNIGPHTQRSHRLMHLGKFHLLHNSRMKAIFGMVSGPLAQGCGAGRIQPNPHTPRLDASQNHERMKCLWQDLTCPQPATINMWRVCATLGGQVGVPAHHRAGGLGGAPPPSHCAAPPDLELSAAVPHLLPAPARRSHRCFYASMAPPYAPKRYFSLAVSLWHCRAMRWLKVLRANFVYFVTPPEY